MLKKLIDIARDGGNLALEMKKKPLDKISKGDNAWNFATQADIDVERLIVGRLTKEYPDIQIIAEEQDEHHMPSGNFFTVDPIDGTIPFSHGFDNWGTILGHIVDGQPAHGVIYLPERDLLIAAQRGKGCTLNGKTIIIENIKSLSESVVETEIGPWISQDSWLALSALRTKCRWLGGSGFVAASIANLILGRSVAYPNFNAKIWDFSASALAITEAGGVAIQPNGQDLRWDEINMQALFAANEKIAKEILAFFNA